MYSFRNILQYGGKYLDEESSRPDVFALDLSEQVMHKLDKTILHGGLGHAGYWRLRTSTASLGTCTRVSLVDPCRWGESTTQGEIHRHFLDIFSHLLVSSSTPSACHLHNLFFSSYVLTDLITCSSHHIFIYIICSFSLLISSHIFFSLLYT